MPSLSEFSFLPPLSLYIHIPWCVRKCPYCDFNSHTTTEPLPIKDYCQALQRDLEQDAHWAQGRAIESIFFGGGTPSLFPAEAIGEILTMVDQRVGIANGAEITLEANPGTAEYTDFGLLRATGVNRLSMGIQSFHTEHLKRLGRIHDADEAKLAIRKAQQAGFDNLNLDLMHGLPDQSLTQAQADLRQAIDMAPTHISWYQLTIEQNTEFYSRPPTLPEEDLLVDIFEAGQQHLAEAGFEQYEISAYAQAGKASRHNMNYWGFGDYLAIGAGAHGKITQQNPTSIFRFQKTRLPAHYLDPKRAFTSKQTPCDPDNLALEFMMNALRLNNGVDKAWFSERTGLPIEQISANLASLQARGMLEDTPDRIQASPLGRMYLNTMLETFLKS